MGLNRWFVLVNHHELAARLIPSQAFPVHAGKMRGEELRSTGLVEAPPDKPALFIDRVVIKKQSPEKPDEVRVWMRLVGFVLRD